MTDDKADPAEQDDTGQLALMPQVARAGARARAREALSRPGRAGKAAGRPKPVDPADQLPVARVLVDVPLAHLDRPFDYLVPQKLADSAVPGARVKVRFAGQDVDGFLVERVDSSEHTGRLAPLRRVVSAEPVLTPAVARLSASVAARYAGTRADVLRLAVPPRHATVEKEPSVEPDRQTAGTADAGSAWDGYPAGAAFVRHLADGDLPRTVWSARPGEHWARSFAYAAAATTASGRGVILCVPDRKDVTRLDAALTSVLGSGQHVVLTADQGPAERYRAFLAVSRGTVQVVLGTRAAAFAPVRDLGLVAIWDDGDDLYSEPRAPYPHTREVLLLRAHEEATAVLIGGFARTVEAQHLIATGWAEPLTADRVAVREAAAQLSITGATDQELARDPRARSARLPKAAFEAIRAGLREGPVLLQAPRQGYLTSLSCDRCRTPARCPVCTGPLLLSASHQPPTCRWCGHEEHAWTCPECGSRDLRAPLQGDRRTAEEIGRAFPAVPVRTSSGERVLTDVDNSPGIVVATPGAEPVAEGGYATVVLLDTWLMLSRPDLRTSEESLRRWMNAAALARPASGGGRVVAVGDSAEPVLQALLRWDPAGFAEREMQERRSARLPPASRLATVTGDPDAVTAALAALPIPDGTEVLGPVPFVGPGTGEGSEVRAVLKVPRAHGAKLSRALVEMQGVRSAKKLVAVRVQVDPVGLA